MTRRRYLRHDAPAMHVTKIEQRKRAAFKKIRRAITRQGVGVFDNGKGRVDATYHERVYDWPEYQRLWMGVLFRAIKDLWRQGDWSINRNGRGRTDYHDPEFFTDGRGHAVAAACGLDGDYVLRVLVEAGLLESEQKVA